MPMFFFVFFAFLLFLFPPFQIDVLSAPPYPGVWTPTRLGFKSSKSLMRISPEALITPKQVSPRKGDVRCVVILVEFQDKNFNMGRDISADPKTYFSELMFGSITSNTIYKFPSFRDFWLINSQGELRISGEVFGPYKVSSTLSDYACGVKNGSSRNYCGMGSGARNLAKDLIEIADKDIDFSKFDGNSDGSVDCFIIIHSGQGGETLPYSYDDSRCCDIWSHAFYTYINTQEGKIIRGGVVAAGISEIFPKGNMGLMAHEFGHLLGLPDLYDAGYSGGGIQSCGVGPYSLMGYGLYKGNPPGTLPSNLSPWEKIYLGWAFPKLVTYDFCEAISSNSYSKFFVKIPAYGGTSQTEYFLVEFRKRELFDADFPSEGVLIWHIDENILSSGIGSNSVNVYECYPGCGNSCGEVKDSKGNFITCSNHYGVRVVLPFKYDENTKTYSDVWRFERTDINKDSVKCLESQPNDFWKSGDVFPDSTTAAYGYEGKPHDILIAIFEKFSDRINIGATTSSQDVSLRSPSIKEVEKFDFASPGSEYRAKLSVQGTPPVLLEIIEPDDAKFSDGSRVKVLNTYEGSEEIVWKTPQSEGVSRFSLRASNCVADQVKIWQVKVQNPNTIFGTKPKNQDGTSGVAGCSCSSYVLEPFSLIATYFGLISYLIISLFRTKKRME
ncbi:MAG: M6 family metalloprotease domain-containing protein [Candidatus Calescibacterium sp.]